MEGEKEMERECVMRMCGEAALRRRFSHCMHLAYLARCHHVLQEGGPGFGVEAAWVCWCEKERVRQKWMKRRH